MKKSSPTKLEKLRNPAIATALLLFISFIEGASVMGVELIGAKMIAPYFGNSIYVWASVLGITLGGLASGYFVGGVISKQYPHPKTLFYILLAAGFFVLIMPPFGKLVMQSSLSMELLTATISSCIFFILPPMFFFGMTSPIIINLMVANQDGEPGEISGKVYAISTAGGILMTFITGLYLIPNVGLKHSTLLIGITLLTCGIFYFVINRKFLISAISCLFILFTLLTSMKPHGSKVNSNVKILYKSDGILGQLMVADDQAAQKRSLHVNNTAQTFIHLPTQKSYWKYIHRISMYASCLPEGSDVLICGLGGGNLVKEFKRLGFNIDVVEIDPRMELIAQQFFFVGKEDAKIIIDDARHYIKTTKKKYDLIVFDMLAAENQPSNIYTRECFNETEKITKEFGLVFIHYQNVLAGENAMAIKSIGKTLQTAKFTVKLIDTQPNWNEVSELMICGAKGGINLENQSFERRDRFVDPFNLPTGNKIFLNYDFSEGYVLTDDQPQMDFLHMNTLDVTRGSSMTQIIPTLLEEGYEIIE